MFPFLICLLILSSLNFVNASDSDECGLSDYPINPSGQRVINGTLVKVGQLPWVVAVQGRNSGKHYTICTGTIIAPNYVLFAAHCVEKEHTYYTVKAGTNDEKHDKSAVVRTTKIVHVHSKYEDKYYTNDIAILEFSEPFQFNDTVRKICLPEKTFNESDYKKPALINGYGRHDLYCHDGKCEPREPKDGKLRRGWNLLVSSEECKKKWHESVSPDKQICSKGRKSDQTVTWTGDSGSALLIQNPARSDNKIQWTAVGITSSGNHDSFMEMPKTLTRVTYYCDWIAKKTKNTAKCF